jgi:dolichyl-phosphate-mannose-protein mannosyltransferase
MGGRWSRAWPIGAILLGGLTLRLIFAFVLFPGQGHANDLGLFSSWASTLAQAGPGTFYSSEGSANYPPGYLYVLWLVGALGGGVELLKPPAILADVGIGALLFVAGRRWFGERAGLIAAALYLFVPVTWYDSALWGQVDAVGALVMLASIVLLIEGWSEPAAALAGVAVLVKPQDAIVLVILIPVLVRRHLLAVGRGPRPALGPVLRAVDGRLGGLLSTQGPVRLATSAIAFAAVVVAGLLPFDIARFAPASLADVPVVGQLAGLVGLVVSDAGQYAVLSANAFNAWALVGDSSIASLVSTGGTWTADTLPVLGGIPAFAVGTALLVATGLVVAGGLLRRDDRIAVLLAFALVAFAFYALPTRVHERYLLPFFAPAALLAALSLPAMGGYVAVALLNAANLHAVLVGTHLIGTGVGFGAGRGGSPGSAGPEMGFGGGGGPGGGFGGGSAAGAISLPFADVFANETAVTLIALGQTLGFVALLVAWVVLVLRRPETATSRPTLAVSLRRA